MYWLPMFDVMMMTVFRKSTVRPCESVSRPSSRICSRMLNTSGCAFSISSNRITRVRPAAHRFGELPAFLVADVARRRADQPRDGVLLHVLRHVDAHHRVLVVEQKLGERARSLGLSNAGRTEEDERADRPIRILKSGARAPHRVRHRFAPLRPDRSRARAAPDSSFVSRSRSPSIMRVTGMPVHRATTSAMSSAVDFLLEESRAAPSLLASCLLGLRHLPLELRNAPVRDLGRLAEIAGARRLLRFGARLLDLLLDLADAAERFLLVLPLRLHRRRSARAARRARARSRRGRSTDAASFSFCSACARSRAA